MKHYLVWTFVSYCCLWTLDQLKICQHQDWWWWEAMLLPLLALSSVMFLLDSGWMQVCISYYQNNWKVAVELTSSNSRQKPHFQFFRNTSQCQTVYPIIFVCFLFSGFSCPVWYHWREYWSRNGQATVKEFGTGRMRHCLTKLGNIIALWARRKVCSLFWSTYPASFFFPPKAQSVRLVPVNHFLLVVLFAAWLELLFWKENPSWRMAELIFVMNCVSHGW